jgi:uncharacterized protein involved in response to NO
MNALPSPSPARSLQALPRLFAAAPHRLLFLVGAGNVLLAMLWWALWLSAARWQWPAMPKPALPAPWLHAMLMQYQVLAAFVFGFLFTVFPRWMGVPPLSGWHFLPTGIGLLGGQLLTLAGALGVPVLLHVGALFTLAGWVAATVILGLLLRAERGVTWHARSCWLAVLVGAIGWLLHVVGLHQAVNSLTPWAIALGTWGLLLPLYTTVAHRMFPFFAGNVVAGYTPWRPLWWIAMVWPLCLGHALLQALGALPWLWTVDLPLAGLAALWLHTTWPRGAAPALLRVLFLGFAWLPLALLLSSAQSLLALADISVLGRAPAHALYVGFFGSLLVAMVTRVSQGHSGRPLVLGRVPGLCFVLVQLVALLRIGAEVATDRWAWMAIAALAWLLAFLPWVARSLWILATPRADGQPG